MATQGPNFPTVATNVLTGTENDDAWATTANIFDADADETTITAATFDSPDVSQQLHTSGYGFTIPAGSTIDGILVEVNHRSIIAGSGEDFRVQLRDDTGTLVGANKADTVTAWPSTATTVSYGGAADTWTASPTDTMVNDPDFGVVLSCQSLIANADVGIAFVRVTITYTEPAATPYALFIQADQALYPGPSDN